MASVEDVLFFGYTVDYLIHSSALLLEMDYPL